MLQQKIKTILQKTNQHIDQLDAELLLAHVIKKTREFVISHPEFLPSSFEILKFRRFVKKRLNNVPLAYLIGHKEFFGLDFLVNKHTLIPRPDTEILVEKVISNIKEQKAKKQNILLIDVGTGSGNIPVSIKKTMEQWNNKTITTYATDISAKALKIAKKNAKKHGVKIDFLKGNLLNPILKQWNNIKIEQYKNLIITANLPYLTEAQFASEPSIQKEPKTALVANKQGLALYEKLLNQIKKITKNHELRTLNCYLEIDPTQTQKIKTLIKQYLPNANIQIAQDLAGHDRVVKIEI